MENIIRCDLSRPTVLMISSDAYYQATNFLKTRQGVEPHATEHDFDVMDKTAERYRVLLEDCKKIASGKLYLVGSTPQRSDIMVELSKRLNVGLRRVCEETGVGFLDWWDELADPITGHLRAELSANAYAGDAHFKIETTGLFIDLLKQEGLISEAIGSVVDYDWTHVFECEVNKTERTRIWCEPSISPNNALKSHKIAASHVAQKTADILMAFLLPAPKEPIAVLNVRDGYLPTIIPPQVHAGCLAITGSEADLQTARVVFDFYGRSDIHLRKSDASLLDDIASQSFSYVIAEIHPESLEEDERRIETFLAACDPTGDVLIGTPDPGRLEKLEFGNRRVVTLMPTGNRHIPEIWQNYAVAILR
ncbi:MAG: hypothetical protein CGW95_10870 [Phenylobacterium zucineum]|nr:MAG: hypothetical protein CGW95_10870 [Phenylobacterium zucineum]